MFVKLAEPFKVATGWISAYFYVYIDTIMILWNVQTNAHVYTYIYM